MEKERLFVCFGCGAIVLLLTCVMFLQGHKEIVGIVLVGMLWGCTNPLMKQGIHFEHPEGATLVQNIVTDIKTLVLSYGFVIPFLINQSGSILFSVLLGSNDFSLIVPLSNALTFIFTFLTAYLLGESKLSIKCLCGVILVLVGVTICQTAK
ncbi:hypothetical protein EIN_155200 [Entamoeba invadens IP1]|uniref:Transmembrane protein n=1 Tax=Entamoeba invadens IP1 TaxID=370355 RepID=A0A0A1UCN0_ENTIV|nr:hypothetical protein EIN_155200 [Entamoeba invadens IP1]ELP91413.1 hypothetical protein EIN_155200 [Entamoeba invadens IP1]|eukprot:XP_004258184.1 hypothetical protein EIN_155200 [Entamoeba invadens IP1]